MSQRRRVRAGRPGSFPSPKFRTQFTRATQKLHESHAMGNRLSARSNEATPVPLRALGEGPHGLKLSQLGTDDEAFVLLKMAPAYPGVQGFSGTRSLVEAWAGNAFVEYDRLRTVGFHDFRVVTRDLPPDDSFDWPDGRPWPKLKVQMWNTSGAGDRFNQFIQDERVVRLRMLRRASVVFSCFDISDPGSGVEAVETLRRSRELLESAVAEEQSLSALPQGVSFDARCVFALVATKTDLRAENQRRLQDLRDLCNFESRNNSDEEMARMQGIVQ